MFMEKIKYPRTWHLPYSEKSFSDDKRHDTDDHLLGHEVLAMLKMDGENTTIYRDCSHARSLDSLQDCTGRRWIETFRKTRLQDLPIELRICGENMFWQHTVIYEQLPSVFLGFSVWEKDLCWSWEETTELFEYFGICTPTVFYKGIYDKTAILKAFEPYKQSNEGFVVRKLEGYEITDFKYSVNKFVNENFKIPDSHWRHAQKTQNGFICDPWLLI